MNKRATALYLGGPLDGQTATRAGTCWPSYRDDNGKAIPAARGDKVFCGPVNRERPSHFYAFHLCHSVIVGNEIVQTIHYVHATIWNHYRNSLRGTRG